MLFDPTEVELKYSGLKLSFKALKYYSSCSNLKISTSGSGNRVLLAVLRTDKIEYIPLNNPYSPGNNIFSAEELNDFLEQLADE